MNTPAIEVENLGKRYQLAASRKRSRQHHYVALRDVIAERVRNLVSRKRSTTQRTEEFWALDDVTFTVNQGDRIGIIGRNGAGKSTLLKILSRITEPTTGRITITGRVASLLEVGTGFHPELTGRENIFLNGAILGMTHAEIRRRFDDIVAFAEVEKFLETPVKRYSSGMYVRLAFAVAAHLEPEILIVDEVLAVGDAEFQKKCLGKMEQVSREGRTVLFVSHDMQSISLLTSRAVFLDRGKVAAIGPTSEVIAAYLSRGAGAASEYVVPPDPDRPNVTAVRVQTSEPGQFQICGKPIRFEFELSSPRPLRGASFSFNIVGADQRRQVHLWTFDSERPMLREAGRVRLVCEIPKLRLYMGGYTVMCYFSEPPGGEQFDHVEGVCPFEVAMFGQYREFPWQPGACTYLEECTWRIENVVLQ